MSIEEAKQVSVSMSEQSFTPPPRGINDIMTVLENEGKPDSKYIKLKSKAIAPPPQNASKRDLSVFYTKRGLAKFSLGQSKEGFKDLRKGYHLMKESATFDSKIEGTYGMWEADSGDINIGIKVLEEYVKRSDALPQAFFILQWGYIKSGNLEAAEKTKNSLIDFINRQSVQTRYLQHTKASTMFGSLESLGMHEQAEPFIREALRLSENYRTHGSFTAQKFYDRQVFIGNLLNQQRFIEAELEARRGIKEAMAIGGSSSIVTATLIECLSEVLIRQGRLEDAKKLCEANIQIVQKLDFSTDSWLLARAKLQLGVALAAQGNFVEAMDQFTLAKDGLIHNTIYYINRFKQDPQVILSQLMTGHVDQALMSITQTYEFFRKHLGESKYQTAEMQALLGMAKIRMGHTEEAIVNFLDSIPIMLANNQKNNDYLSRQRLKYIIDDYFQSLYDLHNSPLEKKLGINASEEAFKISDAGIRSKVKEALRASSARAASTDPELADLVRREQDIIKQLNAIQVSVINIISLSTNKSNPNGLKDLKTKMDSLSVARRVLLTEIHDRFPKYSNYMNPEPVGFSMVQKQLLTDETLVVMHPTVDYTYVWAIPPDGQILFNRVPLGTKELRNTVVKLRKTLAPQPATFEDIPEFDIDSAYELYARLLKPVEGAWRDAKNLIIIAPGALGQVPFSVLPVTSVKLGNEKSVLFSNYRDVPWLIRKTSITRLPSVSSFISLRSLPEGDPTRKPFAGFGDPFFNKTQLAQANIQAITDESTEDRQLKVRGIRITGEGNLDSERIESSKLENLNRLPDTADEIRSIAQIMGVDSEQNVFLGQRASEHQVKTMDLSDRRVIAFASHGLIPGDLDGLDQPAIALSAPSVTGDNDDGLLTMGEILKLKLNADWVVLSACNTGAAEGAGAESISGLGQAFFYAGSRALLVSMWPIETTSAKELTTGLFRFQKENPALSRSNTLKKSMLNLIDNLVLKDEASGKIVASYAHPFFWAPFIVVGDGR